jgi:hypothetical protein
MALIYKNIIDIAENFSFDTVFILDIILLS